MSVICSWFEQIAFKKRIFRMFLTTFHSFPLFMPKEWIAPVAQLLFFKDQQDRFALFTLYKRVTMSKLLLLIFTKEQPWSNWSHRSLKKSNGRDFLFFTIKLFFCSLDHKKFVIRSKKNDRIPNPAYWHGDKVAIGLEIKWLIGMKIRWLFCLKIR